MELNGSLTGFLYDDGKLIAEYDDAGFVESQYIHGLGLGHDVGSLICKETSESTAYYFYNYRGDVIDIVDDAGSIQNSYRYDAFGNLIDSSAPQIGFSSKRYDSSTALSYFGARYYDSTTGRFISRDPLGYIDGPNGYIYVSNNPILLIDPFGLSPKRGVNSVVKAGLATATGLLAIPSPDDLVTVPLILASTAAIYAVSQYGAMVVDEIEQIITPHREVNIIKSMDKVVSTLTEPAPVYEGVPGNTSTTSDYVYTTPGNSVQIPNVTTYPGTDQNETGSSIILPFPAKARNHETTYTPYNPPPKALNGFPGAIPTKRKTPLQGGQGLRQRWILPNGDIAEWDYQHGEVEMYNKKGKHKGVFNDKTGEQTKPAIKGRKIEP